MNLARQAYSERTKPARAALDDTSTLLQLHRLDNSMDVHAPPTAHIISPRRSLLRRRRVGLFSGSFNPLTNAHLAVVAAARRSAALDAVVWAISAVTVDKERVQRATVPDRLAQLAALARTTSADVVAALNHGLYVEEAEALRHHLTRDATLFILVGFDKIVQIFDPHYYADRDAALRDLFALAHILVAPREEFGADALAELLGRPENRAFAPFVQVVPVSSEHARDSSTEARALAARRPLPLGDLRRLLPPEGLALAQIGAYAPAAAADADLASDRYALRERWLHALDMAHVDAGATLPPLSRLVVRAARPTAVGARLRAWLQDPTMAAIPPEVRRIIAS